MSVVTRELDALEHYSQAQNEPEWVLRGRIAALQEAERLPLPSPSKMRIKRWDFLGFQPFQPSQPIEKVSDLPAAIQPLLGLGEAAEKHLLIQKDGSAIYRQAAEELQRKGVIFTDLQTALRQHEDKVKPFLMRLWEREPDKLTRLHQAFWDNGVFLYVPRNQVLELPVQSLFWAETQKAGFCPHVLIVAEENSSLTYVDHYVSAQESALTHLGGVEVFVASGAHVRYASVHHFGGQTTDVTYRRAQVQRDGKIEWMLGEMDGGRALSECQTYLEGDGSSGDAKLIAIGAGAQQATYNVRMTHEGKHTASTILSRGVLREDAQVYFNAITKIEKGAQKANGQQTEGVLMLSGRSRGDANPILLIDEDDVQAGHAASVGQINPEQMYYLMSRGVPRQEAERLIVRGFLAPVVALIPVEAIRNQLSQVIERKLQS